MGGLQHSASGTVSVLWCYTARGTDWARMVLLGAGAAAPASALAGHAHPYARPIDPHGGLLALPALGPRLSRPGSYLPTRPDFVYAPVSYDPPVEGGRRLLQDDLEVDSVGNTQYLKQYYRLLYDAVNGLEIPRTSMIVYKPLGNAPFISFGRDSVSPTTSLWVLLGFAVRGADTACEPARTPASEWCYQLLLVLGILIPVSPSARPRACLALPGADVAICLARSGPYFVDYHVSHHRQGPCTHQDLPHAKVRQGFTPRVAYAKSQEHTARLLLDLRHNSQVPTPVRQLTEAQKNAKEKSLDELKHLLGLNCDADTCVRMPCPVLTEAVPLVGGAVLQNELLLLPGLPGALPAYACAMRCPILTKCMVHTNLVPAPLPDRRPWYTSLCPYGRGMRYPVLTSRILLPDKAQSIQTQVSLAICPRARCAEPGTDIAYGARSSTRLCISA
eukprot:3808595-Rhodomonas_salina.3